MKTGWSGATGRILAVAQVLDFGFLAGLQLARDRQESLDGDRLIEIEVVLGVTWQRIEERLPVDAGDDVVLSDARVIRRTVFQHLGHARTLGVELRSLRGADRDP